MTEHDEPLDDVRAAAMTAAASAARVVEALARRAQEDRTRQAQQVYDHTRETATRSGLNPHWLRDQQQHEQHLRTIPLAELPAPSPEVQTLMNEMAHGQHRQHVDDLTGDMLGQNSARLFKAHPEAKATVYRAAAEDMLDPDSRTTSAAFDQMETRYRPAAMGPKSSTTLTGNSEPVHQSQRGDRSATAAGSPDVPPPAIYDSPARRAAVDQEMRAAGVPEEARNARNVADLLNGADPQLAASAGVAAKPQLAQKLVKGQQRQVGR